MKKVKNLTAIILAKNEQQMLPGCLRTLQWIPHLILVNDGSTDQTAKIAEDFGSKVINFAHNSFARLRNEGLKQVATDWVFYIDPDERVTPTLAKEIALHLEKDQVNALTLNRTNICYGQEFKHGGWQHDQVTRVFRTQALEGWTGQVHESPQFQGETLSLQSPLIHLTHRNTSDGLRKTIGWTKIEAQLLAEARVKPVTLLTLIRKGGLEFLRRAIFKKGYQDGMPGLVEATIQAINKVLIYIQVWELQQQPSLAEQYRQHELEITKLWQAEK